MTSSRDKTIKALVNGCRKGIKSDWAELIDRVAPSIFAACYRMRLSREESFDVFGKVSLLLLEHMDDLREEERLYGYVSTIAHREAMAVKSRARLFSRLVDDSAPEQVVDDVSRQVHGDVEREEELRIMAAAFREMPIHCQDLLRMLFLDREGLSYREISRRLGIPVSSIGPTRMRCLDKLRQLMREKGFEE